MSRLALSALLLLMSLPAQAAPFLGRVAQVVGSVRVNGHAVKAGDKLAAGDVIRTGPGSRADLFWKNGTALRLMANSQMKVSRWDAQQEVLLSWGGLLSVLKKGARYRTASAGAVAAVTGTVYYHEETTANPGYVCICQGRVAIHAPGAQPKTVSAEHHAGFALAHPEPKPAPMLHHTDTDIAELQAYQVHDEEASDP